MRHLGLGERSVSLLMSCIRSVSYSVILNGKPVGNIKPSYGLRQGDPLVALPLPNVCNGVAKFIE